MYAKIVSAIDTQIQDYFTRTGNSIDTRLKEAHETIKTEITTWSENEAVAHEEFRREAVKTRTDFSVMGSQSRQRNALGEGAEEKVLGSEEDVLCTGRLQTSSGECNAQRHHTATDYNMQDGRAPQSRQFPHGRPFSPHFTHHQQRQQFPPRSQRSNSHPGRGHGRDQGLHGRYQDRGRNCCWF